RGRRGRAAQGVHRPGRPRRRTRTPRPRRGPRPPRPALHIRTRRPGRRRVSHNNLANYLARTDGNPTDQLAHRLAATLLRARTTGFTSQRLAALARDLRTLPPDAVPTSFTQLQTQVEHVDGVRFASPCTPPPPHP